MAPSTITVSCTAADAAAELGTLAVVNEIALVPEFAMVANAPVRSGTDGSLMRASVTVMALVGDVLVAADDPPDEHAVSARAAVATATARARPRGRLKDIADMGLSSLSGQGWS
jgi:hypothetical protein